MLAVADRVAGYRLGRLLGRGSSGVVHLAQHERDGIWVALKIMSRAAAASAAERESELQRFRQEATMARALRHPDIVAVLDAGESRGVLWLAMDLVPGTDLSHYTKAARLLPEPLVLRVCQRLAAALAYAHAAGILHRDLKPSNVLVHWPSDSVKLADFGLARGADAHATRTGVVLGSPAYLAPEQLAGARAEPATDLYALGVMLFELLCGRLPFEAPSMGQLLNAVATQPAPDLRTLRPDLPDPLARLVAALLHKSGRARPADAREVALQLAALAAGLRADSAAGGRGPKSHRQPLP